MNKKNSWTLTESTNYIKIINKILTLYYYNILRSSFGYRIFKGTHGYDMHLLFGRIFSVQERRILLWRTSCNKSRNSCSFTFSKIVNVSSILSISVTKIHTNYIVFLQRKKWNLLETLWYTVYGLYHLLLDGLYAKLDQEIHYNLFGLIKSVWWNMSLIKYGRNEFNQDQIIINITETN